MTTMTMHRTNVTTSPCLDMSWMAEVFVVPQTVQTLRDHLISYMKTFACHKSIPGLSAVAMRHNFHRHNMPTCSPWHSCLPLYSVHLPVQNIDLVAREGPTYLCYMLSLADRHSQCCHSFVRVHSVQTAPAIDAVGGQNSMQLDHPFPSQCERRVHVYNPHRVGTAKSRNLWRHSKLRHRR
jgi:hypothetical protein